MTTSSQTVAQYAQVFGDVSPQLIELIQKAVGAASTNQTRPLTDVQLQALIQQVLAQHALITQQQSNVVPVQVTVGNPTTTVPMTVAPAATALPPAPALTPTNTSAMRVKPRRGWLRSWKLWLVLLFLSAFGLMASKTPISVVHVPNADSATGRVTAPGYTAPATGTGNAPTTQAAPTMQPTPDIGNNDPAASAPSDYQEQTKPNTRSAPGRTVTVQQNNLPVHTEQTTQFEAPIEGEGTHPSVPPPPTEPIVAEAPPPVEQAVIAEAAPPVTDNTEHTKASTKRAPGSK